jgi:hypothetical protein
VSKLTNDQQVKLLGLLVFGLRKHKPWYQIKLAPEQLRFIIASMRAKLNLPDEDRGWLIVREDDLGKLYLCTDASNRKLSGWTHQTLYAMHFARKSDAELVAQGEPTWKIEQHVFHPERVINADQEVIDAMADRISKPQA